jgi:hypothetical protein
MIHLALEVLAFLFLCWAGLIVLGIVIVLFDALGRFRSYRSSFRDSLQRGQLIFIGQQTDFQGCQLLPPLQGR